jgi:hypothetical protein
MPNKWNVVVNGQVVSWWLVESAADEAALNLRRAGWGMAYVELERGEDTELQICGYHVPERVARAVAAGDRAYVAKPYPDRHGQAPVDHDWGVWDSRADHWVFVDRYDESVS